jgi:HK97 family phage portal protein
MPDISQAAKVTPLDQGFVSRVAQGIRYVIRGVAPDSWFGPNQPLTPEAQQVAGRQFDYPVGVNLQLQPRTYEAIGYHQLRGLADGYDLLRLVIETRKDQIARLEWNIKPRVDVTVKKNDPRIQKLEKFFRSPDQQHTWAEWLRMLIEDLLVIDAPTLYRRKTKGGDPYAYEVIDGATIKRLIDDTGRTPLPPDPAYQQILKGVPAVDYTQNELLYLPRNLRPNKIYGFSPVEQIVMTVNIALRRQITQLAYYTQGNVPEALIGVPENWSPNQIKEFQEYWDAIISGDLAAKRKAKFIPGGLKYQPTREATLKDDYDEWLARVVCFAFSISPTAFTKQVNRATAETQKEAAAEEGLAPLQQWVKDTIDRILLLDFGIDDLEFSWRDDTQQDPLVQAQIKKIYVGSGIMTINEARSDLGLDPIGPDGDKLLIETATGATLLEDIINPPDPPPMMPMGNGMMEHGAPNAPGANQTPTGKQPGKQLEANPETKDSKKNFEKRAYGVNRIDRDRAARQKAISDLTGVLAPFLASKAPGIAQQVAAAYKAKVGKADSDGNSNADDILSQIDIDWDDIFDKVDEKLKEFLQDAAQEGLAQVNVTDEDITSQVNDQAIEWAKNRAASMVGRKLVDGELVDNPDPNMAITESTRTMLRDLVTKAEQEGWSGDKLANEIVSDYAFSPARAATIARTEAAMADTAGNMIAWKKSGVVQGKKWLLSNDHPQADECNDNADAGVIALDDAFPSGALAPPDHPNCECDVIPVRNMQE